MALPNIGLIGKARAGKDTAAAHLIRRYAYTRVAFADPLKEMALEIDPVVNVSPRSGTVRLSTAVALYGWDSAKSLPEVRRFLQRLGSAQRTRDDDYWLNIALDKIEVARSWNLPVVVTDVRYINEAVALEGLGFKMLRIVRPGTGDDQHISETELDTYQTHASLGNTGPVDMLYAGIDRLVDHWTN